MATYTIKSGDTLGALAKKWGTSVSAIAKANNISNVNRIIAGRKLTIPSGASSAPSSSKKKSSPKVTDEHLDYGFASSFLKANPDVLKIVDKAIDGKWTQTKFLDELRKTKWWKNRSDAQKRFEALKAENPGEISKRVSEARTAVSNMSVRLGIKLTATQRNEIALSWVKNDLDESQVRDMVGRKYSGPGGAYSRGNLGVAGAARAQFLEMARQYGFNLSTSRANEFARNVARGVRSVSDYESYFRQRAIDLFPAIKAQVNAGQTVRDVLDPYVQVASRELGISPGAMNTNASKWLRPVSGKELMSMDDWVQNIRTKSTYGYDQSQNASREASIFAAQLMSSMGAR